MIIWLASYPKSGNTWIRSVLYSLFFSKDGGANIKDFYKIGQYPRRHHFAGLVDDLSDIRKMGKFWKTTQNKINLDQKAKFIKTHHALCNIDGNNFTTPQNTLGVIHIVRDPRNLVTSILHHYSLQNYSNAMKFIFDSNNLLMDKKDETDKHILKKNILYTFISSWKNHYMSWKTFPKNYILIKYEDLIHNPKKEFEKLSDYLSKILKIKIDEKKINKAIETSSFDNLKKLENEIEESEGFKEAVVDRMTGIKKKFFYLGPNNRWQNLLDKEIKDQIEAEFKTEMKELGYL